MYGDRDMYKIKELIDIAKAIQTTDSVGRIVPARPPDYKDRTLIIRIKEAWAVFKGKADAVEWDNQ